MTSNERATDEELAFGIPGPPTIAKRVVIYGRNANTVQLLIWRDAAWGPVGETVWPAGSAEGRSQRRVARR